MSEPDLILALDIATTWGWALLGEDATLVGWGVEKAAPTKTMSRWRRFRHGLSRVASEPLIERIGLIVLEDAKGTRWRSYQAAQAVYGLRAHAEHWAEQRGIEVARVPQATVKLILTGHGRASKQNVARACAARFPGRGFEGLVEAGTGPWDGSDATAVGLAYLELRRRGAA